MNNLPKPTISACMIVKNEEALLSTCLNSIKNAVDEIVIVDTGSTDNTVTIAKSFGVRVYHHTWNNSFSEARNHSLSYASGDWVLQIDADEELEQADIPILRQSINNTRYNGVAVAIISTINDNLHKFYNTRVFRRGKAFYRDIIHEQIMVEGVRLPTEIRLYHHGYNLDREKMRSKWELTTCLLKKQISQDKHNGFAWFNLIRNFRTQELFHDGIKAGDEALRLITPDNNLHHYTMIMYETANCHLHANAPAKARELCNTALSTLAKQGNTPENIDIVFTLACAHLKEGAHRMAIDCFDRYLSLREWYLKNMHTTSLMIDTLGYDYAAYNGIGYCFEQLGQTSTAISHLQRAISLNPKDLTAHKNLSLCYRNLKNHADAVNILPKMPTIEQPVAQKSGRPTISVCMIVKNEEKFLAQCLKSVKDATDEIIIVDTGSTDKTVEIAQSFGAKIYHHPWRNSFSEARNHSLKYATCDWILQIDADEALEQTDIPLLHKLIQTNAHNVIYIAIYSDLPGGQAKHYFPRVFRRGKAQFQGTVHNQLAFEGNALQSEIKFHHYGYNLSQGEMQKKYRRTGDLLREQVTQEPDNIFALANLIRNYRNEYDFDKVVELGEKGLSMSVSQTDVISRGQRQKISVDLAHAFLNKNQTDRAETVCRQSLAENPQHFDMLLVLGETLFKKGDIHDALHYFKKYLIAKEKESQTPAFNLIAADFYSYEHCAYNHIGECYKRLGLINEAEVAYKKAVELNNKEPLYYTNLAYLYLSQNRLDDAENILNLAIERAVTPYQIYLLLGKIYATQKRNEDAVCALRRAIQVNPEKDAVTYAYFINLLIQTNQLKEAWDTLNVIAPYHPDHLGFQCLREKIKYKNGDHEGAVDFILNTLRSNTLDGNDCLDVGDLCMEIEEYVLAIEALERHLKTTSVPSAMVVANIAACYAKSGKLEPALYGFKAALQMDPSCDFALQNLAILEKKAPI